MLSYRTLVTALIPIYVPCPQMTSFHSVSFCYNIDKGENWFRARATISLELAHSPHSVWVFSGYSAFCPHCKDVHVRWVGVSTLSESAWVLPAMERCPAHGRAWPWAVWWPPVSLNRNKWGGIQWSCFYFIFLKCIYDSHLFQLY